MLIDVISDTVCPWCYIGKRRLEAALAQRPEIDFEVVWRPFQLNPDMPANGMERGAYIDAKFGGRDRAKKVYQQIADVGLEEGLKFDIAKQNRLPNTVDSHRLKHWALTAGVQDQVIEGLFEKYFISGEDVGDPEVLIDVAAAAGMDANIVRDLLSGDADRELILREEATSRRMGISGVPCFVIDRKYALVGAQDPDVLLRAIDQAVLAEKESAVTDAAE